MSRPAVLLDRDGTLVHPRHYPSRPEDLQLYEGIGPDLRRLQQAGFCLAVITNQSGLARGYFTESDLAGMHEHLRGELARDGVEIEGIYYCPHHVDGTVPYLSVECGCRKPAPGLLLEAARELDLDLTVSWFVGDILDDVEAGKRAGCHTILVDLGTESIPDDAIRQPDAVARDTRHALQIILSLCGVGAPADMRYRPPRWEPAVALGAAHGDK